MSKTVRPVWIIAQNTFREIIRDRILYGIVVFALLLIGMSLALGQLTFTEHAKISADFGFTGIQLSAAILAIFAGSTLVAREIEKQTVLTLLARPVSRAQFLLGKYFGLVLVIGTVMLGLAAVLALLLIVLELEIQPSFAVALFGILLEALILMAFALLFGVFSRPAMTVIFSVSLFLIGHWINTLDFFVQKSDSSAFKVIGGSLTKGLPNLERFNWRSAPVYGLEVPAAEVFSASMYAFGWIVVLLALTTWIFRRRDFV